MKKNILSILSLSIILMVSIASCAADQKNGAKDGDKGSKTQTVDKGSLPNYRYVDLDTILSRYNLAKDFNDEAGRLQNQMESAMQAHESKINQLANTIQNKMQNNTYLSKESYESDQKKLQNLQTQAQNDMMNRQKTLESTAMKAQQTINDSITNYVERYNAKHGYDAILFKAATVYINPALDITDEIVEGLNAQYNKVNKK